MDSHAQRDRLLVELASLPDTVQCHCCLEKRQGKPYFKVKVCFKLVGGTVDITLNTMEYMYRFENEDEDGSMLAIKDGRILVFDSDRASDVRTYIDMPITPAIRHEFAKVAEWLEVELDLLAF